MPTSAVIPEIASKRLSLSQLRELQKALPHLTSEERAEVAAILLADERLGILEDCAKRESGFGSGPLKWLTQHTKTFNPKYIAQNLPQYAGFPAKDYFVPLFRYFLTEK